VVCRALAVCTAILLLPIAHAQIVLTEGTNLSVDVSADGRIATDLLGGIWIVPRTGGVAEPIDKGLLPARRPRWSPDGDRIVYQARAGNQDQIWLYEFDAASASIVGDDGYFNQHPRWHPDGTRIVSSSDRKDSGFDVWETDVETGLSWRLTALPGDETEPSWSSNGRDLLFVHEREGLWQIKIRRRGEAAQTIVSSDKRLSAPAWRPDGSLVTFLRHTDEGLVTEMAILSEPVLVRTLISDEDFFDAPVSWDGRQQMIYAANGGIRKRGFNSWTSRTIPFQARIERAGAAAGQAAVQRELPLIDAPQSRLVVRAGRLFGGAGIEYRENLDIVVESGRIIAVEPRSDRSGSGDIVIDMGDLTILPGYVDSFAALPDDADGWLGPVLLSYGITTIVTNHPRADELNQRWSSKELPGPRVLRSQDIGSTDAENPAPWLITVAGDLESGVANRSAVGDWQSRGIPVLAENWQVGLGSGASMMLSGESLPASPGGIRYQDAVLASGAGPVTLVSGLADAETPGLDELLQSRQADMFGVAAAPVRRFSRAPQLPPTTTAIVIGSEPNGLPPGIAFHAELRALDAAGLDPENVLRAAGINAAGALSASLQFGRIAASAHADLVLVDGDPLNDIGDTLKVVAVVRNGRFFSVAGLLETALATRKH
jgi:hypothetical protein